MTSEAPSHPVIRLYVIKLRLSQAAAAAAIAFGFLGPPPLQIWAQPRQIKRGCQISLSDQRRGFALTNEAKEGRKTGAPNSTQQRSRLEQQKCFGEGGGGGDGGKSRTYLHGAFPASTRGGVRLDDLQGPFPPSYSAICYKTLPFPSYCCWCFRIPWKPPSPLQHHPSPGTPNLATTKPSQTRKPDFT